MTKLQYYTIDSDKLIKYLIDNEYISLLGKGNRYDLNGHYSDKIKRDNTYNWEISQEDDDETNNIYNLSHDFEIGENDNILILSKHISGDIRGNYEDDYIYIKEKNHNFLSWIYENLSELEAIKDIDN